MVKGIVASVCNLRLEIMERGSSLILILILKSKFSVLFLLVSVFIIYLQSFGVLSPSSGCVVKHRNGSVMYIYYTDDG